MPPFSTTWSARCCRPTRPPSNRARPTRTSSKTARSARRAGRCRPLRRSARPPRWSRPASSRACASLIQRIQLSPAYNPALGLELGIVAPDGGTGAPTAPPKPTTKAVALPNSQVRLDFVKGGFTGVLIEARRAGEDAWAPLGTDNFSPYVDTRPPLTPGRAEVREYRLRYLERDEPVGDYSDIISASTTP